MNPSSLEAERLKIALYGWYRREGVNGVNLSAVEFNFYRARAIENKRIELLCVGEKVLNKFVAEYRGNGERD